MPELWSLVWGKPEIDPDARGRRHRGIRRRQAISIIARGFFDPGCGGRARTPLGSAADAAVVRPKQQHATRH